MTLRRVLRLVCLALTLICLAGGFAAAEEWLLAVLVLLPVLALLFAGRLTVAWLPVACLTCLISLAAVGLLGGAPAYLMIPGAATALGAWDLTNLGSTMAGTTASATSERFERKHIRFLALALGLGLLLAASARLFSLDIPFVLLLLLAGLDLFCLDRAYRWLTDRHARSMRAYLNAQGRDRG